MDHFSDVHWILPTSVFVAGIVGSPHCVSMCGPIVVNFAHRKSGLLAYQIGRMLSYCAAGAAVGAVGQSLFGADRPAWFSNASLLLIAVLLVFNSYRVLAGKPLHFPIPRFLNSISTKAWGLLRKSPLPPSGDALLAGLLTVFLPCGHLFSFLLGAAATGDLLKGAAFMFAFWLGSTPVLSLGALGLQKFLSRPGRQRFAGILLLIAGLFGIFTFGSRIEAFSNRTQKPQVESIESASEGHCH